MEIGTKIRILTDEYYAAGPNWPDEPDIMYIKMGAEATVVEPTEDFKTAIEDSDDSDAFPAVVAGMQNGDVLFIQPSEEGIAWEVIR